jgi:3-hydroxy-D-aspartate aldolase
MNKTWYPLSNEAQIDSPTLLIYKDRVEANIQKMIDLAGDPERLFVHIKTNKTPEIVQMMLRAGIRKFKCATLAEAEMAAMAGCEHILIAHQLVGPKIERLVKLRQMYPKVFIASLLDDRGTADATAALFARYGMTAEVFLDVNNGMDRSGFPLSESAQLFDFYRFLSENNTLRCHGLHVYDGHRRDPDFALRKTQLDAGFEDVNKLSEQIKAAGLPDPMVVAGGTPAFTVHRQRAGAVKNLYYSPGTSVLWDWGYGDALTEQPFEYAALVLTRVVSKPAQGIVTIDLGHKAVAAENPVDKRVRFLNLADYELLNQSEEHGVLRVKDWQNIRVGDVLYGVPYHICPTVNLYEELQVVENGAVARTWQVLGRKRRIGV